MILIFSVNKGLPVSTPPLPEFSKYSQLSHFILILSCWIFFLSSPSRNMKLSNLFSINFLCTIPLPAHISNNQKWIWLSSFFQSQRMPYLCFFLRTSTSSLLSISGPSAGQGLGYGKRGAQGTRLKQHSLSDASSLLEWHREWVCP